MISGNRKILLKNIENFLEITSIITSKIWSIPSHRRPDTIIQKMIRGMLPRENHQEKSAHKRLRAHIGVPNELKSLKKIQFDKAKIRKSSCKLYNYGRTRLNNRVD